MTNWREALRAVRDQLAAARAAKATGPQERAGAPVEASARPSGQDGPAGALASATGR